MVLVGVALVISQRKWNLGSFFPSLFLGISLFIATITGFGLWLGKQVGLPNKLRLQQCVVVEGAVTALGSDFLQIGSQTFHATPAVRLHQVHEGQTVRIHHVNGDIARLETTGP